MRFTNRELRAVAEYRVDSKPLRFGWPRNFWHFLYFFALFSIAPLATLLFPAEFRGHLFLLSMLPAVFFTIIAKSRDGKLIQTEYEYIKVKYEEGKWGNGNNENIR